MNYLYVNVIRINDNERDRTFQKVIEQKDIELAVCRHGEEMQDFRSFTKEVEVKGFKVINNRNKETKLTNTDISFRGDTLTIQAHNFHNCIIRVYFTITNKLNREKKLYIDIETNFTY